MDWTAIGTAAAGIIAGAWGWYKAHAAKKQQGSHAQVQRDEIAKKVDALTKNIESLSSAIQSGFDVQKSSVRVLREEVGRMANEVELLRKALPGAH